MENKKVKKNKKEFPRWIPLFLYSHCFGKGDNSTHLGLRFRGEYYCISHAERGGYLINKEYLKMQFISPKLEYLKRCCGKPNIIHKTRMYIREDILVKATLFFALNKYSK